MTVGAIVVALQVSLVVTVIGAMLVGAVLAPLGTYYSLVLDKPAPPNKRPEVFALLRTANSVVVALKAEGMALWVGAVLGAYAAEKAKMTGMARAA